MAEESLGIALGSNQGNRIENLRLAVESLQNLCEDKTVLTASVFETQPVDCPKDSAPFFNTVIEIKCALPAKNLLAKCQEIERNIGRIPSEEVNAPRPIDLDILYYGEIEVSTKKLTIPHPLLTSRRFVLEPLSEIRPGLILPGKMQSIEELLADLDTDEPPLAQIYPSGMWL